jgi:hypothetical protein
MGVNLDLSRRRTIGADPLAINLNLEKTLALMRARGWQTNLPAGFN